ncbi:hypothetical protein KFL_014820020 [Klebsormidium nitens]|uniref:Uncharacterized protein n=1 Tax=Klebsormidium nitens TaxID=105231 RepID=A0A1Y1IRA2_KLENI|nr:hypothetical protein KFL_014820020 [Klebsormidium nitens]|eukprot:GAQ93380.1 hypothetical protein KFL_014820020 [Klebsormidium nitens]
MAEDRAARGRVAADEALAREIARQEEDQAYRAREERVVATSRDAELAMELVAREAQEKGVDRAVALAAQKPGEKESGPQGEQAEVVEGKGKQKAEGESDLQADLERGLAWERKLGAGQWRGARQVAAVTLQAAGKSENGQLVEDAHAHTRAMACFAEGRPKPEDMDSAGLRVHTATGRIEALKGGLTRQPVPIVLNAGTPDELTLYERLAITDSTGYDLLLGTRAAYPCGLSVNRWQERAVYRVDWAGAGQRVGALPMQLHQKRPAAGNRGSAQGPAGAALACCLTK